MNKLSTAKRTQVVAALVEGNSVRATCRMTGAAKGTVLKLEAGVSDHVWSIEEIVGLLDRPEHQRDSN